MVGKEEEDKIDWDDGRVRKNELKRI